VDRLAAEPRQVQLVGCDPHAYMRANTGEKETLDEARGKDLRREGDERSERRHEDERGAKPSPALLGRLGGAFLRLP